MSKRIQDDTKISKSLTVNDWKIQRDALIADIRQESCNIGLWERAYTYFIDRVYSRFLNPIQWILSSGRNQGEGFSIVALQCILIEFLEAFYQGKVYTTSQENLQPYEYNSSRTLFRSFLMTHHPFSSYFAESRIADGFYANIRCGLLHEARTKQTSRIKKSSQNSRLLDLVKNDKSNMIIYRENFHQAIVQYLELYKKELFQNKVLMINFIRKLDDICGIQRAYYFAYGSNLEKKRLLERINKFHTASPAILSNYRFGYNKKSIIDGTSKANITTEEGSTVHGICYEIDKDDLRILDQHERGYNRKNLYVIILPNTSATAITYMSESIIHGVQPTDEYRKIVLEGARDWQLNEEYIQNVL